MTGQPLTFYMDERFWIRVNIREDHECWEWEGARTPAGYGRFRGKPAHRVSYELEVGKIPDGLIIRHKCDNRPCVNPRHLETGTHKDNAMDMMLRGRAAKAERHYKTGLSERRVRRIVDEIAEDIAFRCGLGDEWDLLGPEAQQDIKNEWSDIVRRALEVSKRDIQPRRIPLGEIDDAEPTTSAFQEG